MPMFSLTTVEMAEKKVCNQTNSEASKGNDTKTPSTNVNMVDFIPSKFWASMDQPNSLIRDVLIEEVKWAMLFEDTIVKPTVM